MQHALVSGSRSPLVLAALLLGAPLAQQSLGATPFPEAAVQSAPAAVQPLPAVFPAEAIRADLLVLRKALETLHPGIHRYATPEEFARRCDELERSLDHDCTLDEAFLAIARFVATIRCGHTYCNIGNQGGRCRAALTSGRTVLPLHVRWIDRRLVVLRDAGEGARLAPGTEIRSINGRSVAAILDELLPIARADGGNDAKRIERLGIEREDDWHALDAYLPLLHPSWFSASSQPLDLEIVRPGTDGAIERVRLATIARDERIRRFGGAAKGGDDAARWTFDIERSGTDAADAIGVLAMPGWAVFNSDRDWKAIIDDAFRRLDAEKATGLVIDLRGNEGGLDCGDRIIAHLVEEPFRHAAFERWVRYIETPDELDPSLDTWDDSFRDWRPDLGPMKTEGPRAGFARMTRYDDGDGSETIEPVGPRFAGRVVVLVDAANSSAAFQFAALAKDRGLATLVGTPTGGNLRGINGSSFFFLRLPNTTIEVDLPLVALFPPGETPLEEVPDSGLAPDIVVETTIEDIAAGRDPVLARAKALLAEPVAR
jgi:hypothetical protein